MAMLDDHGAIQADAADCPPGHGHGRSLKGLRVLVLDDEAMVAILIEDMLTELGCIVVGPANSATEALFYLAAERVDVAVVDINLSRGNSGYPVAADLERRGLPFAFITGYGAGSIDPAFRDRPTLQKPFHMTALIRLVTALAAAGH